MSFRLSLVLGIALMVAVWALGPARTDTEGLWTHAASGAQHVRIVSFYASVGALRPGERAKLCYGVENARSVQISPLHVNVYPLASHCFEVEPHRTTHYTILAVGFDGDVATRSLTLPVETSPARPALHHVALAPPDLHWSQAMISGRTYAHDDGSRRCERGAAPLG